MILYIRIVFCHTLKYFPCRVCRLIVELIYVKTRMNELCRNDLFRYQRCITQIWLVLLVGLNTVLRILLLVIASYCC